jgi:hypothetical protein
MLVPGVCGLVEAYFRTQDSLLESGALLSYNKLEKAGLAHSCRTLRQALALLAEGRHAGSTRVISL